jgi:hypothetical protein
MFGEGRHEIEQTALPKAMGAPVGQAGPA